MRPEDRTAFAGLPALFAALMLATAPAAAMPARATLCNGGSTDLPGQPMQSPCHAACQRRTAGDKSLRLRLPQAPEDPPSAP